MHPCAQQQPFPDWRESTGNQDIALILYFSMLGLFGGGSSSRDAGL